MEAEADVNQAGGWTGFVRASIEDDGGRVLRVPGWDNFPSSVDVWPP
jgi:hypothetical protein